MDQPDQQAHKEPKELQAERVQQAERAQQAHKEQKERLVPKVQKDQMAQQARQDLQVQKVK
jgi:hypothetical protein|tara:strand:+ start:251 stop:433 length:183 start_codon:yes stop_codon:yes gene_type:complete